MFDQLRNDALYSAYKNDVIKYKWPKLGNTQTRLPMAGQYKDIFIVTIKSFLHWHRTKKVIKSEVLFKLLVLVLRISPYWLNILLYLIWFLNNNQHFTISFIVRPLSYCEYFDVGRPIRPNNSKLRMVWFGYFDMD